MKNPLIIVAAVALVSSMAQAGENNPSQIKIGDEAVTRDDIMLTYPACKSNDDMSRTYQLGADHDPVAMTAFMGKHGCEWIPAGTKVKVEDQSVWHGSFCVRATGNPDCYWVPEKALITTTAWQKELDEKAKEQADAKKRADQFNEEFDKVHPECKDYKTNPNLPARCY